MTSPQIGLSNARNTTQMIPLIEIRDEDSVIISEDIIGEGSFGKVFKVTFRSNHVAVKLTSRERAMKEIYAYKLLRDFGIAASAYFMLYDLNTGVIIMEMLRDLHSCLEDGYVTPMNNTLLCEQAIFITENLHCMGMVHGDIKLENIGVYVQGRLKLIDWADFDSYRPDSQVVCGSLSYMHPDKLCNLPYDNKIGDIWSICICVYALLYTTFPFRMAHVRDKCYRKCYPIRGHSTTLRIRSFYRKNVLEGHFTECHAEWVNRLDILFECCITCNINQLRFGEDQKKSNPNKWRGTA